MFITLSAYAAIFGSWVTIMKVLPWLFTVSHMLRITSSDVLESRLPVGSSANIMSGSVTSALAMPTRCCCPPDICPGMWFMWLSRPTSFSAFFAILMRLS